MNTLYHTLQFNDNHLIVRIIRQYDHNNKIKSSASNNEIFTALSLYRLTEYSTGNEYFCEKQHI